ncbi:hypothetical protein DYH09_31115 [bacterium CPR1]|nr:hypothetical protein [bacterium CPR1]
MALSTSISQIRFLWLYFAAITFAFYGVVELLSVLLAPLLLPMLVTSQGWAVMAYQGSTSTIASWIRTSGRSANPPSSKTWESRRNSRR